MNPECQCQVPGAESWHPELNMRTTVVITRTQDAHRPEARNSQKYLNPCTFHWSPNPKIVDCQGLELRTQDSGQYLRWKRHFSKMFESTFHISINILPTPEPQVPGAGCQVLICEIIHKCVNQLCCKSIFLETNSCQSPQIVRVPNPKTQQSTISGFGGQ
jgi:hypothetical protein